MQVTLNTLSLNLQREVRLFRGRRGNTQDTGERAQTLELKNTGVQSQTGFLLPDGLEAVTSPLLLFAHKMWRITTISKGDYKG